MYTYKLVNNFNNVLTWIDRSDGVVIPIDPANADYKEYLEWVAEGNTPEPADE
jgi:hypothetical protein